MTGRPPYAESSPDQQSPENGRTLAGEPKQTCVPSRGDGKAHLYNAIPVL